MLGKNPFRTFLYVVVSMVLVKLCYNLGYGLANKRLGPANRAPRSQAYSLPGLSPDPADSAAADAADAAEAAPTTTPGE